MASLLSFLITIFLLKSTLPRELKKVFNAGFNFLMVTSGTVFFSWDNVIQVLLLYLYPPVEKRDSLLVQKGSQYNFQQALPWWNMEVALYISKQCSVDTDFKVVTKKVK